MKSSSSRIVRFFELKLSHGAGALNKEPWDLKRIIETAIAQNFYSRAVRDDAKRIVRPKHGMFFEAEGKQFAAILFAFADSEYIDASYEKMATGAVRTLEKESGEGYRTEAHLVIDLAPSMRGDKQVYAAVLEESAGLSPSVILSRLQYPLHQAGKRESNDKHGIKVAWYPLIEMDGLLSKSLIDEIERGELEHFDLVKEQLEGNGIDEPQSLIRKKQVLVLDVKESPAEGTISNLIATARQVAFSEGYERVRIHYKEADTGKSKSAVVEVDEDAEDPGESVANLVSRTRRVDLDEKLNYNHTAVVESLAKKMASTLVEELSDSKS